MSQTSIEIYNTVTEVQVIEITTGGITTTADLNAAVTAAESSASSANSAANSASLSAQSASLNAESAEESSESAFASSDVAQTAATSAAISAQQASASAMLASEVSLQQSFGRKFVPTISLDATSRTVPCYLPCVRAGVATFFDPSGVLRTANANEGRIDFDPTTGECLGLLSEGQYVEYARFQHALAASEFAKEQLLSFNQVGTFGSFNTLNLVPNTTTSLHGIGQGITLNQNGIYKIRTIVKSNGYNFVTLQFGGSSRRLLRTFNLTTGEITNPYNTGTILITASAASVGDGFWLLELSGTALSPNPFDNWRIRIAQSTTGHTDNGQSFAGDGIKGILYAMVSVTIDGQNINSFGINNTGASPLTRPADLFATTGFQFAKRYNQREGTFYINTRAISDLTSTVAVFSDGTTNNETRLLANGTLTIRKAGAQIATIQATGATLNEHSIFGFTYKGTRVGITRNGATVGVVTASEELATNYTQFQLGTGIYVRNLRYIPRALSDSELQFVTNPLYFVGLEGDKVPTINDLSSGAFMEVQDLQALRTRSEITIFGTGALRSIVINRPYPFLIEQVYVSPTGVTTATIPSLPVSGFYAANTDYTVLFNATADRTLVLGVIPQTIN